MFPRLFVQVQTVSTTAQIFSTTSKLLLSAEMPVAASLTTRMSDASTFTGVTEPLPRRGVVPRHAGAGNVASTSRGGAPGVAGEGPGVVGEIGAPPPVFPPACTPAAACPRVFGKEGGPA